MYDAEEPLDVVLFEEPLPLPLPEPLLLPLPVLLGVVVVCVYW